MDNTTTEKAHVVTSELKQQRVTEWRKSLETELQRIAPEAAELRRCITSAKTATKRRYYDKKLKRVQASVLHILSTMQRLDTIVNKVEETEDGSDTPER